MNKFLEYIKKYIWLLTTLIALGGLIISIYQARTEAKSPILRYYIVRVSPEIREGDFQNARRALENSLFLSVNNFVAQHPDTTFSEALDSILPLSETIGSSQGGIVIVIQNQGTTTAQNILVNITLGTPIEKYQIFSNELFSVLAEDKPKGILKINIERLTTRDDIQIPILFPGAYSVSLVASRLDPETLDGRWPQGVDPIAAVEVFAAQTVVAQTAVASDQDFEKMLSENMLSELLYFHTKNYLYDIQVNIFISSDEVQGELFATPKDTSKERNLFFSAFQQ